MFWNWFGLGRSPDWKRCIFRYRDGTRIRRVDPVAVEGVFIKELGEDWRDKIRKMAKPSSLGLVGTQEIEAKENREKLRTEILAAVDKAFGVQPFTDHGGAKKPEGLTEIERLGLLEGFLYFCADLLELARPFGSAQSRASPSPEPPPSVSGAGSTSPATS